MGDRESLVHKVIASIEVPPVMGVYIVTFVLMYWSMATAMDEPLECLSIICTPPKTCQVIDEIAQCVLNPSVQMPSFTDTPLLPIETIPSSSTLAPPPELCSLPPVSGHCSKSYVIWFYNAESRKCERFSYSGCGNENRFYSRAQCELTCLR